jgi:hypothetical protein
MSPSTDELDATGLRDAQWFATRLRERAQERIVHSFRAQLLEGAAEPADEDLAIFAKLAAEEHRLSLRRAEAAAVSLASPLAASATPAAKQPEAAPRAAAQGHWLAAMRARWRRLPDAKALIDKAARPSRPAAAGAKPLAKPSASPAANLAPWRTVIASAAVVCFLFGGFAFWYPLATMDPAPTAASVRPATPIVPVAVASASTGVSPAAPAAPAMATDRDITSIADMRLPSTAVATAPSPAAKPDTAAVPASRGRPERAPPPTAVAARPRVSDPLAGCRSLNFFARAICMNDTCAQRQFARHSACGTVLAQRRVDEARRNPTLLN